MKLFKLVFKNKLALRNLFLQIKMLDKPWNLLNFVNSYII